MPEPVPPSGDFWKVEAVDRLASEIYNNYSLTE